MLHTDRAREGDSVLPHPLGRDWYKNQHEMSSRKTGQAFEDYATAALDFFHDDFVNPTPAGALGDGGVDGLAEAGDIAYACYGSRPQRDAERALKAKMESDFSRAVSQWSEFTRWRFITNSPAGPLCAHFITDTQKKHDPSSVRPIAVRLWMPEKLWTAIVSKLDDRQLGLLFPGLPGIANLELQDLVPLLEELSNITAATEQARPVRPVPINKMDYNLIPELKRWELNSNRHLADRIDSWFEGLSDPDLRDHQGAKFREIYVNAVAVDPEPSAALERIYIALGGSNFRADTKRANAVYAVTSYFFDLCHIFETPPEAEWDVGHAASN